MALGRCNVGRCVPSQVLGACVCTPIQEGFSNIHMAKARCLQGRLHWCSRNWEARMDVRGPECQKDLSLDVRAS